MATKFLLVTAMLGVFATSAAHAMDDTMRAQQMAAWQAAQNGKAVFLPSGGPGAATSVDQMSPLHDDGTPMNIPAKAGTLGAVQKTVTTTPAITTITTPAPQFQPVVMMQPARPPVTTTMPPQKIQTQDYTSSVPAIFDMGPRQRVGRFND